MNKLILSPQQTVTVSNTYLTKEKLSRHKRLRKDGFHYVGVRQTCPFDFLSCLVTGPNTSL
jgi:hypothetical protein